jgi:Ni/Fe-hydrogenase subunit HybB-like protein
LATAGYSAFLFGQAEGRDFWQGALKLPHLLVAALAAGSAALLLLAPGWERVLVRHRAAVHPPADGLVPLLIFALVAHAALVLLELLGHHSGIDVTRAARLLTRGALAGRLWSGVIVAGVLAPITLVLLSAAWEVAALNVAGALLALGGLWLWEDLWVRAGQSIPLS